MNFDSAQELERDLLARAEEASLELDIAAPVLRAILPAFIETVQHGRNDKSLKEYRAFFPRVKWAIRNDEWKLYETVVSGISAFAAAGCDISPNWPQYR